MQLLITFRMCIWSMLHNVCLTIVSACSPNVLSMPWTLPRLGSFGSLFVLVGDVTPKCTSCLIPTQSCSVPVFTMNNALCVSQALEPVFVGQLAFRLWGCCVAGMGSKMLTISKIMLKCAWLLLLLDPTDLYVSPVCNLPLCYFCVKESHFNNKICDECSATSM